MLRRLLLPALATLALSVGCAKEDPEYTASLHARCQGCVVSYAGGVFQSKKDTLYGLVDPATGDTIPEERHWTLPLKDGQNLFFRACRLDSTALGTGIHLWVDGDVRSMAADAATGQDCAEINQAARGL